MPRRRRNFWYALAAVALLALVVGLPIRRRLDRGPRTAPAPMATWPWPSAVVTRPYPGVTCWTDHSSPDATVLRLYRFDFAQNPGLRFALYDQDQDDATPFDDTVDTWPIGVAQATAHLNAGGRGTVVAAWNGLFFDEEPAAAGFPNGVAHHVAPTVENGVVRYNVGNPRWTFGLKCNTGGHPSFRVLLSPGRSTLARSFTFASGGAECLIDHGRPLAISPFPAPGTPDTRQSTATAPGEAGHIPSPISSKPREYRSAGPGIRASCISCLCASRERRRKASGRSRCAEPVPPPIPARA